MKGKMVLISFMVIMSFLYITNVQAADTEYSLGAKKGTEIVLEVKTLDEEALERVFDDAWEEAIIEDADEVGVKQKIKIRVVDEYHDFEVDIFEGKVGGFGYVVDVWEWTDEAFEKEPDEEDERLTWFKDPGDLNEIYKEHYGGFSGEMPFVPIPVAEYLEEVEYRREWGWYENNIVHRGKVEEKYTRTYTYDEENGFLSCMTIQDSDNTIIYEVSVMEEIIFGYALPVLLVVAAISALGIIFVVMKKMRT